MSATPEPEVRWWRHGVAVQAFPESAAPYLPGMGWTEVTVTPVSGEPSDAERPYCPVHGDLLAGVRSERCRTAPAGHESDADVAERIAQAVAFERERAACAIESMRDAVVAMGRKIGVPFSQANQIQYAAFSNAANEVRQTPDPTHAEVTEALARSHTTPPVAIEVEWEWHLRDESGDLWTGPFASEEQAQAARRESRPHWIVVRRRRAGPWIEVPTVAATGEEVDHYPMSAISVRGESAFCDWCGGEFESVDLYREHERVMVLARRAREAAATGEEDGRG